LLKRIIIGPGLPLRGGISESNEALNRCFRAKNETSLIVSFSLQYPKFLFPGKKQIVDDLHNIGTEGVVNLINTLNPFTWFKAARFILNQKPDYVIVRYWHPYFAICLSFIINILRKKSILIIAWVDNINPHESVPFQKILTSFFIKKCDAFVVMSQAVKNEVMQYSQVRNKEIIFTPHPIYNVFGKGINKYKAQKKIGVLSHLDTSMSRCILFFGLIRPYKGLSLLLDVMSLERIKKLNIKLVVAGEFYDSKEKYIKKINSLQLNESIILHDFYIPNKDVKNYFSASDIVVQPYLSATQSGVSMVAYNFNKPMILTNVGGLSEYVNNGKDGYLVNANKDDISSALEDFYINSRESKFMHAIKEKKKNLTWEKLASQFDKVYNSARK